MSKKRAEFRFQSIVTVIIVLLLLISFVPIALMIMLSFKTNAEVYSNFFCFAKEPELGKLFIGSRASGKKYV